MLALVRFDESYKFKKASFLSGSFGRFPDSFDFLERLRILTLGADRTTFHSGGLSCSAEIGL